MKKRITIDYFDKAEEAIHVDGGFTNNKDYLDEGIVKINTSRNDRITISPGDAWTKSSDLELLAFIFGIIEAIKTDKKYVATDFPLDHAVFTPSKHLLVAVINVLLKHYEIGIVRIGRKVNWAT